jgi:hypothetical protein
LKAGSSLPGTCSVGELFFLTRGTPGSNIYTCSAANAWTGAATVTVFGRTGAVVAQNGDYTFSQIAGIAAKSQLPSTAVFTDSPPASPGFCERVDQLARLRLNGEQVAHLGRPGRHTAGASPRRRHSNPGRSPRTARHTTLRSSRALREPRMGQAAAAASAGLTTRGWRQPSPETRLTIRFTQPPSTRFRRAGA